MAEEENEVYAERKRDVLAQIGDAIDAGRDLEVLVAELAPIQQQILPYQEPEAQG